MGHLVNPLSYRLYNIRYWNNNWFLFNHASYSYVVNQDILLRNFFKKVFSLFVNITEIGSIFVNLKVIRSFNTTSLYLYIHDSFLELLFLDLRKSRHYLLIKKRLKRVFLDRYRYAFNNNYKFNYKLFKLLKKRLVLKYSRKLLFIFLKNKVLSLYWNTFKSLSLFYLRKFSNSFNFISIYILGLTKKNVNAQIISEFFFIRLKQYYTIWEVLRNINYLFKHLMRNRIVRGYRITCSGRFSRKQRATYSWKTFGSLALSTMKSRLDFSYRTIALKYSVCTVKVWVRLGKRANRLVDFII